VSYLHAGGIDRPLTITKDAQEPIIPHQNWRGTFAWGTWGKGTYKGYRSDCVSGGPSTCVNVAWPGWQTNAWHVGGNPGEQEYWTGSLADGQRNVNGQIYMRNRYYDPATGQFTQVDPIGLAGGLNAYGFAAGDPVTYSDPFGLCPICVAYGIFEAGSTLYDIGDLAVTTYRYVRGRASGRQLLVTAIGVGVGVYSFGGGYGRAGRAGMDGADDALRTGWRLNPDVDLDWRGTGRGLPDAVAEAVRRTGADPNEFRVTQWGRDANGKSFPVEWRSPGGAEVNIDVGHTRNGPGVPHVGYQTPGKRGSGGAIRGHILLDDVPVNR
jgi:RHS repeat-associated protein